MTLLSDETKIRVTPITFADGFECMLNLHYSADLHLYPLHGFVIRIAFQMQEINPGGQIVRTY